MEIKKNKNILDNINYNLLNHLCFSYNLKIDIEEEFLKLNLNKSSEINFGLFENEELFYDIQILKLKEDFIISQFKFYNGFNLRNLLILIQYMLKILDNYDNIYKNYIFKISLSNILDFISGNHNDRLIDTFDYFF